MSRNFTSTVALHFPANIRGPLQYGDGIEALVILDSAVGAKQDSSRSLMLKR